MPSEPNLPLESLSKIRDNTIMLVLGNAYFCAPPFLRKIGDEIDAHLQKLRDDIAALKKDFPGKYEHETNPDEVMGAVLQLAQRLKNPDQALDEQCTAGALGRELEGHVDTLTKEVNALTERVFRKRPAYSPMDSIANLFGRFGAILSTLFRPLYSMAKIAVIVILLALLPFCYFFLTMDREKDLREEIANDEAFIHSQMEALSEKRSEKEQIAREIDRAQEQKRGRRDKIGILELNVDMHKVEEEMKKIEVNINIHEKKIEDNLKKIEEIKKKPFLKRLLKY